MSFDGIEITDAELARLPLPASCRNVHLRKTKVTLAGLAAFKARFPGVKIRR